MKNEQSIQGATSQGSLGPLQQAVLDYILEHPGCSVRDVREALAAGGSDYAYTTIQTVCDALHAKKLVSRRRQKLAYLYTARQTRGSLITQGISELLARFSASPQPVASSLIDALEADAPEQLEALIAELRQRGKV